MENETFNANYTPDEEDGRKSMQSLGRKIAEQIASHSTTDRNNDIVYLGKELPEEMRTRVQEGDSAEKKEEPRGSDLDGFIDRKTYPRHVEEPSNEYRERIDRMQNVTNGIILEPVEIKIKNLLNNKIIAGAYDDLLSDGDFRDGQPSNEKRRQVEEEVREIVPGVCNLFYRVMLPNNPMHDQYVEKAFQDIYVRDLANDNPNRQISKAEIKEASVDQAMADSTEKHRRGNYDGWYGEWRDKGEKKPVWEYLNESPRVAAKVIYDHKGEMFGDLFNDDVSEERINGLKRAAIETSIREGQFLPKTIAEEPEKADEVLEENAIDKNSDYIAAIAIDGLESVGQPEDDGTMKYYNLNQKRNIAKFFNLNEKISEMMDEPEYVFKYVKSGNKLYVHGLWDGIGDSWKKRQLDPEITHKALERLESASSEVKEQIDEKPNQVNEIKNRIKNKEESDLANDILFDKRSYDFGRLLKIAKISCRDEILSDFVEQCDESRSFKKVLLEYMNKQAKIDADVAVDYGKAIQDGLKKRLAQGVLRDGSGRFRDLTGIFESQEYLNNKNKIGLDFSRDDIKFLGFNGFINTLKTPNGEKSDEAEWYYNNLFAGDIGKFLSFAKCFKENSTDRGVKGKLTKFINENEAIQEYKRQQEVNKRLLNPNTDRHRTIRAGVIKKVDKASIEQLLKSYELKILKKLEKGGAVKFPASFDVTKQSFRGPNPSKYVTEEKPIFDFGVEKGTMMLRYLDFVKENVPNSAVEPFICVFKGEKRDSLDPIPDNIREQLGLPQMSAKQRYVKAALDDPNSYYGFMFNYEGKRCMIAESFNNEAGMYLAYETRDDGFRLMDAFKDRKRYARADSHIAEVNHLDKEHFEDSLDETYKKAFLFFRTGNKGVVEYGQFGGRGGWNQYQEQEFPAWPLSVNNDAANYVSDIARYNQWQRSQAGIP